ncbi:unnamed protein product [Moneuplotes crassus]|uniref:Uncharacterized protein n=1 Tax=Euplotes crassus TaxID=5936 RepID=A0AAD1XBW2_EUPCR|nr:unnamed protein product [Moneuplotes crassus]
MKKSIEHEKLSPKLMMKFTKMSLTLQKEQRRRFELEAKLYRITQAWEEEKKNIIISTRQELQDSFDERVKKIQKLFLEETQSIYENYQKFMTEYKDHKFVIKKFGRIVTDQELKIDSLRREIYNTIKNEPGLKFLIKNPIMKKERLSKEDIINLLKGASKYLLKREQMVLKRLSRPVQSLEEQDKRESDSLELMKYEFDSIKKLNALLIDENTELKQYKIKFELKCQEIEQRMKAKYSLNKESADEIKENYEKKLQELVEEIRKIRAYFKSEVIIKDMLIKRHKKYTHVLKKELVLAKNIMKNPRMVKKMETTFNFDSMDIYQYDNNNISVCSDDKMFHKQSFNANWSIMKELQKSKNFPKRFFSPQSREKNSNKLNFQKTNRLTNMGSGNITLDNQASFFSEEVADQTDFLKPFDKSAIPQFKIRVKRNRR